MTEFDRDGLIQDIVFPKFKEAYPLFKFTTNMDHALLIVEQISLKYKFKCFMTVCNGKPNGWEVEFGKYRVYARTLPLAICLCALQVHGIKV